MGLGAQRCLGVDGGAQPRQVDGDALQVEQQPLVPQLADCVGGVHLQGTELGEVEDAAVRQTVVQDHDDAFLHAGHTTEFIRGLRDSGPGIGAIGARWHDEGSIQSLGVASHHGLVTRAGAAQLVETQLVLGQQGWSPVAGDDSDPPAPHRALDDGSQRISHRWCGVALMVASHHHQGSGSCVGRLVGF